MKSITNENSLLEDIKSGGVKRQQAIATIYRDSQLKNQVVSFVRNNSGNSEEGIDIFHEGIIAMDDNVRKDKYRGDGNLKAYLYSICRFLWLNRLKKDKRMVYTEDANTLDQVNVETPESLSLEDEQKNILNDLLGRLGDKCQQILEMWKLSYSMEEIAEKVGLDNAGIARRQRYNCYQKLLSIIDSEPALKNILKSS
ncbi:MAG: sigma-70 family RNA polymerase sigma factor [Saprospiraceae bacterium]|nr:sigma-70 family RNA polymerase sigma factor [Saprospiraceae bacterium]